MYLYNIHTHNIGSREIEGYKFRYILNTFPDDFEKKSSENEDVWFSCGIHPWYIDDISRQISLLEEIASDERVVAIGEAGLDKMKGPDINIQIDVFRQQIELAVKVGKPLIIHCVKAWDELVALHKEYKTDIPWIIHGYRGNAQQAAQLGKIGFKFSFGEHFNEETLRSLPIESIFCETDTSEVTICKVYSSISDVLHIEINQFVEKIEYNIKKYIK